MILILKVSNLVLSLLPGCVVPIGYVPREVNVVVTGITESILIKVRLVLIGDSCTVVDVICDGIIVGIIE
ncbi:hypothetical protein JCM19240_2176 [Vibrio maritimus]|uniref:Uncharacterized protein n=1 Tax=Vibrio maritimus TaxID=990268 RepID=A0A090T0G4_9VIBR|nr:hypothetical protein JCM19240_2176 [Vibrio maritimus]